MNHLEQQDNSMDEDVAVCEHYLWNFVLPVRCDCAAVSLSKRRG
jgi:hypothetical protein